MQPSNVLQQMMKAPYAILDPGNGNLVQVSRNFQYCSLAPANATSGAETRSLSAPLGPGLTCSLGCKTYGNGTITVAVTDSSTASTGNIVFNAAGQWAQLWSFETSAGVYAWQVTDMYGCTTTIASISTLGTLAYTGATGTNILRIPNTLADAFDIKDVANNVYYNVNSTTCSVAESGASPGATSAGGTIAVTGGAGGATSGNGGAVTVTGGAGTNGNAVGGASSVIGGAGQGSAAGGAVSVTSGAGGATGASGAVTVGTGVGGSSSGVSGNLTIVTGTTTSGASGTVTVGSGNATGGVPGTTTITAGAAQTAATAGGAIAVTAGNGNTSGNGGAITVMCGAGGTTGNGGAVSHTGGTGGSTSGTGGAANITGGSAGATTGTGGAAGVTGGAGTGTGAGGAASLIGGAGATSGAGGAITITSGAAGSTGVAGAVAIAVGGATAGNGSAVTITGGNGAGGTNAGGNVNLVPGTAVSTGIPGEVQVNGTAGIFEIMWSQPLTTTACPAAASVVTMYCANRAVRLKAVRVCCTTHGTSEVFSFTKDASAGAAGGGTNVLAAANITIAASNTPVLGTVSSTIATVTLQAGDRISFTVGGTVGAAAGVSVSLLFVPC
jgi:hypothetical protein